MYIRRWIWHRHILGFYKPLVSTHSQRKELLQQYRIIVGFRVDGFVFSHHLVIHTEHITTRINKIWSVETNKFFGSALQLRAQIISHHLLLSFDVFIKPPAWKELFTRILNYRLGTVIERKSNFYVILYRYICFILF